jgi:hypothetical protein
LCRTLRFSINVTLESVNPVNFLFRHSNRKLYII